MQNPSEREDDDHDAEIDADAVLAELEAEEDKDVAAIRDQRVSEIQRNSATASVNRDVFSTLRSDDDTLRYTTEHEKAIVHFLHPDFARCSVMDEHLRLIAQSHADYSTDATEDEIKFARVDVKDAEFVVQKLGIRVLPCVIGFVQGQIKGRIVGFEGVNWQGMEQGLVVTTAIEERFIDWGLFKKALVRKQMDDASESEDEQQQTGRRGITGRKQQVRDEDDDWD